MGELPEDTIVDSVRIKLPKQALKDFRAYAGGEPIMYFAGGGFGDVFMSPDPPGGKRRLYPFPPHIFPSHVLEWEVAE